MAFHVAGFVKLAYLMPDCHQCAQNVRIMYEQTGSMSRVYCVDLFPPPGHRFMRCNLNFLVS